MEIYWLGHSCFRLKGKDTTVIVDPFNPEIGYQLGKYEADIVVVTHQHSGHNYIEGIQGESKPVVSPGEYEIANVFLTGIGTFHDDKNGELRGKNISYSIEIEGISICHLGDLGHVPSSRIVGELGRVDVLLVPVGGISTIDATGAADVVRRLEPKVVIPMHYKTPSINRELHPVERFLKEMGVKEATPQLKLSISKSNLSSVRHIVLLDYPGNRNQS